MSESDEKEKQKEERRKEKQKVEGRRREKKKEADELTTVKAEIEGLKGLVSDLLTGFREKLAPRIDALETAQAQLAKAFEDLQPQLTASFTKQSELLKKYVDEKIGGGGQQQPQQQGAAGGGGLIQQILDMLAGELRQSGGLTSLLRGTTGGENTLVMEIKELEKLLLERERAIVRNSLRRSLGLPELPIPSMTEAAAPGPVTLEHK
jgi:hypothetical protein